MAIGDILGDKGSKHQFEHNGKVYSVSRLKQKHKAQFVDRVKAKALEPIARLRESLPESQWLQVWRETFRVVDAYSWYSTEVIRSLSSEWGMIQLAAILFDRSTEEMESIWEERQKDLAMLIDQIILTSLPEDVRKTVEEQTASQESTQAEGQNPDPKS